MQAIEVLALQICWHFNCNLGIFMWNHWVARACTPYEPFKDFNSARWMWTHLIANFPELIAAILMPNHLHLILPQKDFPQTEQKSSQQKTLQKLGGLLGVISKQHSKKHSKNYDRQQTKHQKITRLWQPTPPPTDICDPSHLRRHIRYVALNPCRKQLCADPLEWYWSTYREVMGATVERSKSVVPLFQALQRAMHHEQFAHPYQSNIAHPIANTKNIQDFRIRFHSYVSGDPSVSVQGTKFPSPSTPQKWAEQSVSDILWAASAALRIPPTQIQKKGPLRLLFIHLAARHGWRYPQLLAHLCQITPSAVHKILNHTPPNATAIDAAELCLGDPRLRSHPFPIPKSTVHDPRDNPAPHTQLLKLYP